MKKNNKDLSQNNANANDKSLKGTDVVATKIKTNEAERLPDPKGTPKTRP